jgi:uncharacterized protein
VWLGHVGDESPARWWSAAARASIAGSCGAALEYRLAAEFWGITDPRLAVLVNAVVGGTLAYRREFVGGDAPRDIDDFSDWVIRTVLSPEVPLFREVRYLLADEGEIRDTAIYHAVLGAIASGHGTRGGIASDIGRKSPDIGHPLAAVLEDMQLMMRGLVERLRPLATRPEP